MAQGKHYNSRNGHRKISKLMLRWTARSNNMYIYIYILIFASPWAGESDPNPLRKGFWGRQPPRPGGSGRR